MPFVQVPPSLPGIISLFAARPDLGAPMSALAEALLRGPSSLSPGERELIATHVSACNQTQFCQKSHAMAAKHLLGAQGHLAEAVRTQGLEAPVSPKMKALLRVAGQVAESGLSVTQEAVDAARAEGANDDDLHQCVAIAAAFCMYNRYVDGLRSYTPEAMDEYDQMGAQLASQGYLNAVPKPVGV